MFKEGDRIICIDDSIDDNIDSESRFDIRNHLKLYDTYIVSQYMNKREYGHFGIVMLEGIRYTIFNTDRFIPFSEFRKMKINKIINNV